MPCTWPTSTTTSMSIVVMWVHLLDALRQWWRPFCSSHGCGKENGGNKSMSRGDDHPVTFSGCCLFNRRGRGPGRAERPDMVFPNQFYKVIDQPLWQCVYIYHKLKLKLKKEKDTEHPTTIWYGTIQFFLVTVPVEPVPSSSSMTPPPGRQPTSSVSLFGLCKPQKATGTIVDEVELEPEPFS